MSRGGDTGRGGGDCCDELVYDLGDARRERRFGDGVSHPLLRVAAGTAIGRDPLQQAARPGQRQDHGDIGWYGSLTGRRRPYLLQDRLVR